MLETVANEGYARGDELPLNVDNWLKRAEAFQPSMANNMIAAEALQFAVSMAVAFYGQSSPQLEMIQARYTRNPKDSSIVIHQFAIGAIRNMVAEIQGGLVENVRLQITGEVLADLVALARDALAKGTVHVAAVLTAAAFEDTLRSIAKAKIGLTTREKLDQVLLQLKNQGVFQGGEPGTIQGFLKFRNDSLHADWANVQESQVASCLSLVDTLIVKHLS
jgi:hypothetical protein